MAAMSTRVEKMIEPILYIDFSEVREGKLSELKTAIDELIAFIDEKVPRIIFYSVYFSKDGKHMTVAQMHPNAASLEYHMEIGAPVFAKFKDLLQLNSIELYGKPSEPLLLQLNRKAKLLGNCTLTVHDLHAGINKFNLDLLQQ
jgi:hypothetical protein